MQVNHVDITKDRQKTGWTELDHRRTPLYGHQITRRLETADQDQDQDQEDESQAKTAQIPKRKNHKQEKIMTSSTGVSRHQNPP